MNDSLDDSLNEILSQSVAVPIATTLADTELEELVQNLDWSTVGYCLDEILSRYLSGLDMPRLDAHERIIEEVIDEQFGVPISREQIVERKRLVARLSAQLLLNAWRQKGVVDVDPT